MRRLPSSLNGYALIVVLSFMWLVTSPWRALCGAYHPNERALVLAITPVAWATLVIGAAGAVSGHWWMLVVALMLHGAYTVVRAIAFMGYALDDDEAPPAQPAANPLLPFRLLCAGLALCGIALAWWSRDWAWLVATVYALLFELLTIEPVRSRLETAGRLLTYGVEKFVDSVLSGILLLSIIRDALRMHKPESEHQ